MLEHGSCRVFTISQNRNEYKRMRRTLADTKNSFEASLVNDTLIADAIGQLKDSKELYLIHDPSDIRKPHSEKIENLGKVRDLNGNIINGYSTYNIVGVEHKHHKVHLLSHGLYSNNDPKFLKAKEVKFIKDGKGFDGDAEKKVLYESDDWFNKNTITKDNIESISKGLKESLPDLKLVHILDREFDSEDNFSQISNVDDEYVIRGKVSRKCSDTDKKLADKKFVNRQVFQIEKYTCRRKVYQNASLLVEWEDFKGNTVVRITAMNRGGEAIFKAPMLLFTNRKVSSGDLALLVYKIYMKRSRIETVFKFLKEGMGWETAQIRDFEAIKNVLSLSFFLAAYLYDIGAKKTHDDFIILLADLADCKGKITRHFIFKGMQALLSKFRMDAVFEKHEISYETQQKLENIRELVVG